MVIRKTFNGFIGHYSNKLGRHLNPIIKNLKINIWVCVYMKDATTECIGKNGKQRKISNNKIYLLLMRADTVFIFHILQWLRW